MDGRMGSGSQSLVKLSVSSDLWAKSPCSRLIPRIFEASFPRWDKAVISGKALSPPFLQQYLVESASNADRGTTNPNYSNARSD